MLRLYTYIKQFFYGFGWTVWQKLPLQMSSTGSSGVVEYSNIPSSDNRVTLVVDGTRFIVDPAIFAQHPETMLGRWEDG